ncbi:MtnX-like HAD-IB family phosphatase [Paracoccus aminophilus]|uniref:Phosphoserine phosphatase n=1 Tax=Paracoccus aminophilus JCM 7686 TaxID=1367847 RepID=S5YG15_PARAH|nr:MtnX-like HAD-IB family phosphatase [Paracoccus aminophilus]AGT10403.1 phosphoserine phosphatase [Paracoccus aminophilus JCM 7686]
MQVYCDFDGTISVVDGTDHVLSRLADPAWEEVETLWLEGAIDSGECMRRQVALIRASRAELDAVLDGIAIDPGFADFAAFCHAKGLPLTIVSDGVDYFIRRILARHGLDKFPVIANRLSIHEQGGTTRFELVSPHARKDCTAASGVCKCAVIAPRGLRIFVGDGRSDFCVSDKPELVYAKGKLADFCADAGTAFIRYDRFAEITAHLRTALPGLAQPLQPDTEAA